MFIVDDIDINLNFFSAIAVGFWTRNDSLFEKRISCLIHTLLYFHKRRVIALMSFSTNSSFLAI